MYRGYTGHEHLYGFVDVPGLDFGDYYACEYIVRPHDAFNLINMNGRLYDPVNGRMLSVDNYSHDGLGSQGYNRYSYAHNNPLKYTDPDGEFPVFILPEISWSGKGGLRIGLTFGVGVPGALNASASIGYSFRSKAWDASIQGAAGGFYAGYGTGGAFAGYGYRYGGFSAGATWSQGSGFGIGVSVGGTTKDGVNGSIGASWSQNGGFDYNVSAGYTSEIDIEYSKREVTHEIPVVDQRGANNCVPACIESIERSYGNSTPQEYIREWVGGNPETVPLNAGEVLDEYSKASGTNIGFTTNEKIIFSAMQKGARVLAIFNDTYTGVPGVGHAMTIKSAWKLTIAINGGNKMYQMSSYKLMNPSQGGGYTRMSGSSLQRNTWGYYSIFKK